MATSAMLSRLGQLDTHTTESRTLAKDIDLNEADGILPQHNSSQQTLAPIEGDGCRKSISLCDPKSAVTESNLTRKPQLTPYTRVPVSENTAEQLVDAREAMFKTQHSAGLAGYETTLRSTRGLQELFSQGPPTASAAASTQDPLDALDLSLQFTCRGRCGMEISFPCGCSASCVVYGTCCDDMDQDCPDIVREAHSRFGSLFNSGIICDENLIYTIASCPRYKPGDEHGSRQEGSSPSTEGAAPLVGEIRTELLNDLLNQGAKGSNPSIRTSTSPSSNIPGNKLKDKTIDRFNQALLASAPITDVNSGFTFVNRSIFDCHSIPDASMVTWLLRLDFSSETPLSLDDLLPFLKANNSYTPPFNQMVFFPHLCFRGVIRSCSNKTDHRNLDPDIEEKCQSSNAVVRSNLGTQTFYANRFCAYCNEGRHDKLRSQIGNQVLIKRYGLHLLMSLSPRGEYMVELVTGNLRPKVSWTETKCYISEETMDTERVSKVSSIQTDKTVCETQCENWRFHMGRDGMCRSQHTVRMAVADDIVRPLCPSALHRLADFITCGLALLSPNLERAQFHAPDIAVQFDTRIQKTLYLFTLKVDLIILTSTLFFEEKVVNYLENFISLATLARFFREYSSSHDLCTERDQKHVKIYKKQEKLSSLTLQEFLPLYYPDEDYAVTIRRLEADDDEASIITVCASLIYETNVTVDLDGESVPEYTAPLVCTNISTYDTFADKMEALNGSKCSSHLQESDPGSSGGWRVSASLVLGLMAVGLLLKG
ncbi:hypothetical protein EGW08_022097 [Elysia chlorotica]|uniref:SMB domain-containing protein n=1 Tax=Elysia chlorotica TaxID=188477 RepID=A0A3S1BLW9_ELYCH|nr:hypothetical protein EGW08_022097 [Elysia chlorotica]